MAKLKYEKFKSGLEFGAGALYRFENNNGKEVIFGIGGIEISTLLTGYDDIDFDAKSDEILSKIPKDTNAYFSWTGHNFFPCERGEIIKNK